MGNRHRVHVRQAAARQPGLERVEPVTGGVKSVKAAGAAHAGTQRQCLAARASAKIDHHLAALGIHQHSQQLRAFVLHFNGAASEGVELAQLGFVTHAQAPG